MAYIYFQLCLMLTHFCVGEPVSSNQDTFDISKAFWVYRGNLFSSFNTYVVTLKSWSITQFFFKQIVLKDEPDVDPNDQNSILEHLDKVVVFF